MCELRCQLKAVHAHALGITVLVPCESVTQFLAFQFHVQTNRYQHFRLARVLQIGRRIGVVEAHRKRTYFFRVHPISVDWRCLWHRIQMA